MYGSFIWQESAVLNAPSLAHLAFYDPIVDIAAKGDLAFANSFAQIAKADLAVSRKIKAGRGPRRVGQALALALSSCPNQTSKVLFNRASRYSPTYLTM